MSGERLDHGSWRDRRVRRLGWAVLALVLMLLGFVLGQRSLFSSSPSHWPWEVMGAALGAAVFGALVGLSEILTRYRDEPLRATFNLFGLAYLTLNALISLGAFLLLRRYDSQIFPSISNDLLLISVAAGFGAMVIMRSKLFTFNTPDGQTFAVGPAIVIDTILQTIDQKIDRLRAAERQERVYQQLQNVAAFEPAAQYLEASLLSFQNLSEEQKAAIHEVITEYRQSHWDDRLKIMAVGFAFLTIAGEENFAQVVENMKRFLQGTVE